MVAQRGIDDQKFASTCGLYLSWKTLSCREEGIDERSGGAEMDVSLSIDHCYGDRMKMKLVVAILGLSLGWAHGSGVEAARKLVSESKKGEVEVMKVLDLVAADLREKGVDQVLGWVIENGGAEERKRVGELLPKVPENDKLVLKYVQVLAFYGEREQLKAIVGKAKKGRVQQEARFRLALSIAEDAERNLILSDEERAIRNQEAADLLKELKEEKDLDEFVGPWVDDLLFKVTHLVVGCQAPEIEGVDHEGEKFRLSEYRGKVVLLPFWGFW